MSEAIERGATRIALRVSRDRNRRLLAELLTGHDVVDITDTVPEGTDLCIVDDRGISQVESTLTDWKHDQHPTYAPVLLLSESGGTNLWEEYASLLGEQIDAIQPIPAPKRAIRARVESLLETRQYSWELASERQLVEQIFDTSPIAKTVLDTEGNIVRANQRAEDVLGLSESELSGRAYDAPEWQIIDEHGDPIPSDELPFSRVMASGEPVYGYEHAIERPDRDRAWLSINMGPVLDENGDIEYLVSAIEDVTERKRLERELRVSEELHRATLSNITDTVFITDDDGRFTYVCPNVHFIFGYTGEEVREMGTVEALLGDDPAPDGVADGDVLENIEQRVTDAEGDEHTVLVTVNPVSIQDGTKLYSARDVTDLVESERRLERERERLEAVVSNAPLILSAIDSDGTITLSKGKQLERIGLEPGELVGESVSDAFGDMPEILENAERALDGEEFWTETQVGDRYLEAWHQPVFEDGDVDHAIIVAQDITDRKRQEERFRAFVEGSSDIIAVLDSDGFVEYVSPSVERILGYDSDELVGENAFEIVHPDDRDDLVAAFADLSDAEDGSAVTERYRTRHADGTWRWTESRTSKQTGMAQGMYVLNTHDITEQVEAERDLRRTEQSRSLALNAANAGVWEWDIETDEVIWHESCERLFGLEPGTFEGTYEAFADRIHPEDLPDVEKILERSFEANEPFHTTFRIIRDDRVERWIEARGTIVSDEAGNPERMLGVDVDITDHKDRVQQLRVMDRVLRHNLHNDMNVVRGFAEMVRQEGEDPVSYYGEQIVEHSDHLLELTDKQRTITDVLSNEPQLRSIDTVSTIQRTVESISDDYPNAHISLDLPEGATVSATDNLGRAIDELVTNAIKHADQDAPDVDIRVTDGTDTVQIRIVDTGPGIPEMDRRVVLGEHEIEPLYHGSGLGLWLVSWIIRRSNGSLWFEDNEPRGSVVVITLRKPTGANTGPRADHGGEYRE